MPNILIINDVFHPDPAVSSVYLTEFARSLQHRGWGVTVLATNRPHRGEGVYAAEEDLDGVRIVRVNRLPLDVDKGPARLLSSFQIMSAWVRHAVARLGDMRDYDVVLLGSGPAFASLIALPLRPLIGDAKLVHWCFDVFPDAIVANGVPPFALPVAATVRGLMRASYDCYDLIVDLGPRMRERLPNLFREVRRATLVPWAFVEPDGLTDPAPEARRPLFGDAALAVLYSGTLGRVHTFENLLELARECRRIGADVAFAFSCRDAREGKLREALRPEDTNVALADFVPLAKLQERLNSADLHMMSIKPAFSGVSVPSKFFGSIAVGKPVIYDGPEDSDIARYIQQDDAGMLLSRENIPAIAARLGRLAHNPAKLRSWQARVQAAYQRSYRRASLMDRWDAELRGLLV